ITAARRALTDTRRTPSFIATVHGRGYRFLAAVTEPDAAAPPAPGATPPRPRGATSFVGREAVLAELRAALADAIAGRGRLLLLQFLTRELGHAHLLVVAAYRDVALRRDHPLAQVLAELTREPICGRVMLRGLGEADVRRFVDEAAGHAVDDALVTAVHRL